MEGPSLQEFIDRYNAAWNDHDVEAIVSMHTEDSVFENHTSGGQASGLGAIRDLVAGIFRTFPDLQFTARRLYVRDDLVVQEWTATATHSQTMTVRGKSCPPTGKRMSWNGMDVSPMRDGKVLRKDVYVDSVSYLKQLGISAKFIEKGGADLIIIYNSGRFRMAGRGSTCGLMAYGDANAIVVEMASEVLPVVRSTPVLAGVNGVWS